MTKNYSGPMFVRFPLPKIAGIRILPIYILGLLALPFLVRLLYRGVVLVSAELTTSGELFRIWLVPICIMATAIILLFVHSRPWKFLKQLEVFRVTAAFFKAKKDKVCPMVEFVDE